MSGSRFPWLPVLVLAAATAWAAGRSGAAPSRDTDRGWDAPTLLAQVAPDGGAEEGGNEAEDQEPDLQDTLDVDEGEPLTPDTTQVAPPPSAPPSSAQPADTSLSVPARADTTLGSAAPSDTSRAAEADTLRGTATPDSASAVRRAAAVADTAGADTLFMPKPRPQPAKTPAPSPPPVKKPRTGILGIHPIVILLGVAVLHYMVVKTTGD